MKTIALFDFCGTMVKPQTIGFFCREVVKQEHSMARMMICRLLNQCYRNQTISPLWLGQLRGMSFVTVDRLASQFADKLYNQFMILEVIERLSWHQAQGHEVVIVSAGLSCYLEHFIKKLNVRHLVATELDVENTVLTGKISTKGICFGAHKVTRLQDYLLSQQTQNIDWEHSYAYTDHVSDLPLLNLVGYPVVVRPKNTKITPHNMILPRDAELILFN